MTTGAVPVWRSRPYLVGAVIAGCCIEAAMAWRFGWSLALPAYLCFGAVSVTVSVTDLADRRIPNRVVASAYPAAGALLALASIDGDRWSALGRAAIAILVLAGFYLALGLAFPGGMGLGDCKWAGIVGLYLGWLGWSALVTGTLVAFLAAAAAVLVRHLVGSRNQKPVLLPMAPFMAAGAVLAVLAVR